MPFVDARLAADPSAEITSRTIQALTDLTVRVLGKERPRTTVAVGFLPRSQWRRGGSPGGFFVEARITDGTNSSSEKARYVREVHDAMAAILGVSGYVAVNELDADSWGHGGETQAVRYSRSDAEAAAA